MGYNDHLDFDLYEAIRDLVDQGLLEEGTPAHGIAQKVAIEGYDSLSPKQAYIYETVVVAALKRREKQ